MAVSKADRKKALRERTNESVKNGDGFVKGKKGSILDFKKLCDDPEAIIYYEPKHGKGNENHIDILPFEVKSRWYEKLRTFNKNACGVGVGHLDYKLEIPIHYDVGAGGNTTLCIREAFGHKCAVCDEMFELYAEENGKVKHDKRIKKLRPKWRCFYNIYDYDAAENPDAYRVWECSYHNFESKLKADAQTDDGGSVEFADPETGKTIVFKGNPKVLGKNPYVEAGDINFEDRTPYDEEELLTEVFSFDLGLKIPTEEDVRVMHETVGDETGDDNKSEKEPEAAASPRRRKRNVSASKPDDDNKCPAGGVFGTDMNELEACQKCGDITFASCEAENVALLDEAGGTGDEVPEKVVDELADGAGEQSSEQAVDDDGPPLTIATPVKRGSRNRNRNTTAAKPVADAKRKRQRGSR